MTFYFSKIHTRLHEAVMCCIIETEGNVHRRPLCVQNKRYGFTAHTEYSTLSLSEVCHPRCAFKLYGDVNSVKTQL